MVGLQLRQSPAESWLSGWRTHTLEFAGLFVIGLMTAIASIDYPWAPLLMALPTAILYLSLKHTVQLLGREQAARVEAEAAAESVRRLQAVVEQERATLASVMASMSDGLLALDAARRIRYCNARAGELLGIDPATVRGESAGDVVRHLALSLAEPGLAAFWDRLLTHPAGQPRGEFTLVGPPRRDILVSAFRVAGPTEATLGLLLRDVSDSKQLTRLEERERIAMDLHDGVIQSLYGVALGLGARARTPDQSPDETRSVLCQVVDQINSAIHDIRSYVFDLRQPQSDDGLAAELMALISELQMNTLLRAELDLDPAAEYLVDPDAVPNLVQIAREATCNVVRHANASTVRLRLARTDEQLVLMVCDNGKGFRPTNAGTLSGHGLSNMAERARALGGRLVVVSEPARGTEVRVEVPVAMLGRRT